MTIQDLPPINASLNGLSTLLLIAGWFFIRAGRKKAHIGMMLSAIVTSTVFLACYLTYHFNVELVTRFTTPGWPKLLYFIILISHSILAAATPFLVILTVIPALRARFDRHRRIARWTLPIWLYVSFTGVLVYLMLYQWFPPAPVRQANTSLALAKSEAPDKASILFSLPWRVPVSAANHDLAKKRLIDLNGTPEYSSVLTSAAWGPPSAPPRSSILADAARIRPLF